MSTCHHLEMFKDEVKSAEIVELLNSIGDELSLTFESKFDHDCPHTDDKREDSEEEYYERVPVNIANPCPENITFEDFRRKMLKINNQVYKKLIKPGVGSEVDMERAKVTYEYAMFTEFSVDPFDSSAMNEQPGVVCVKDDVEPLPGCYLALASMKVKEEAVFLLASDVMYGKLGCSPRIKPNADVLFYAKIVDVQGSDAKKDTDVVGENLPFRKFMKQVGKQYSMARDLFDQRDFMSAIGIYRKWIDKVENFRISTDKEEDRKKEIIVKMYQNAAICYNKINNPQKACIMLRELERLVSITNNPKALFAKGKALMMLNRFDDARKFFTMASAIVPKDTSISNALELLNKREQVKVNYETRVNKLQRKFKQEAHEKKELDHQTSQEQRKRNEALQTELNLLKADLTKTIQVFKNDQSIDYFCLLNDLPTAEHIQIADQVCEQHGIRLKGNQKEDSEDFDYYLTKNIISSQGLFQFLSPSLTKI